MWPKVSSALATAAVTCCGIGDVERQCERVLAPARDDVRDLTGIPCGDHGSPAAVEYRRYECATEAGRAAGDEPDSGS